MSRGAIISLVMIALASPAAIAQELMHHRVELIVFRHLDQSTTTVEAWAQPNPPPDPATAIADPRPDLADLVEIIVPDDVVAIDLDEFLDPAPIEFLLLDPAPDIAAWIDLDPRSTPLMQIARRMVDLPPYDVLLVATWVQTGEAEADAVPVDLQRFGAARTGLEGEIRLYRQRFAHLEVDLRLPQTLSAAMESEIRFIQETLAEEADERGETALFADRPEIGSGEYGDIDSTSTMSTTVDWQEFTGPRPAVPVFSLKQSRRMRGDQYHYIDHPVLGVIAKVSVVERRDLRGPSGLD